LHEEGRPANVRKKIELLLKCLVVILIIAAMRKKAEVEIGPLKIERSFGG